jgi:hypothetical protein
MKYIVRIDLKRLPHGSKCIGPELSQWINHFPLPTDFSPIIPPPDVSTQPLSDDTAEHNYPHDNEGSDDKALEHREFVDLLIV